MNEQDPKQNRPPKPDAERKAPGPESAPTPDDVAPEHDAGPDSAGEPDDGATADTATVTETEVDLSAKPTPDAEIPATPQRSHLVAGIVIAVLVLLAGGEAWLFNAQSGMADQGAAVANLTDQVDTLRGRLSALDGRIKGLENKVADLASRPVPQPAAPKPAPAPTPSVPPELASKIAAMQANIASLSTTTLADHAAITTLKQQGADLPKLVARAQSLARIAQASLDLQNGQPLGSIPDAPPALARYATAKPPTLSSLKASFAGYADAAARAGGTTAPHGGFWQNVKGRIESLVTVRHKDKVLIGSSAAGTLSDARTALDRDDLAGAIAALEKLPAAAASAMQPWTEKAKHLLAARAALAKMAEQG